ncbi:MAG: ABC transporter substrate-binding protein [Thermoanaerobaculia bacterium]
MTSSPRFRSMLIALVVVLSASGLLLGSQCLGAATKPVSQGGLSGDTLRIGFSVHPDTLEITQVTNTAVASLLGHVVETLVSVDENGRLVPQLAERYEVSPDGREITFHLPRGVTFQDGTPLNAAAVVWNINRLQEKLAQVSDCAAAEAQLASVDTTKALDVNTVRFTLKHPAPDFLPTLSWIAYGILSPRSEGVPGNKRFNIQHPVGTGPYAIAASSADQLQLTRFEGYRGERPYFSKLDFRFVTKPEERQAKLAGNQLDVILDPTVGQLAKLAQDTRFEVVSKPSSRTVFVNLNNQRPPFNDVRVRRAVNLAVDKQALIDQVLLGNATAMDSPLAANISGYCSTGSYAYDPAAARALLAEAKVAPGTHLKMLTPRGRYLEDEAVAQKIAGYLRAVGFTVTVEAMEWPVLMGELYRPPQQVTADMHVFGWSPTFPEASWQLPHLYDSKRWPPVGSASSFYKNPEVDKMLDAASLDGNSVSRNKLFCEAEQKIWDDAPAIFLWAQNAQLVTRAGLTNVIAMPNEKISVAFARPTSPGSAKDPGLQPAAKKSEK